MGATGVQVNKKDKQLRHCPGCNALDFLDVGQSCLDCRRRILTRKIYDRKKAKKNEALL